MSGVNNGNQDVDIDLGGLFRAIWNRRYRVLLATVCVAGLAFAGASMISPTYRSEARLLIEPREPAFTTTTTTTAQGSEASQYDESGIASQVQLLRSVDLIKQVARDMKLYEIAEFDPTANPSALSDVLVLFGLKKNPLDLPPEDRVLTEFMGKLQVYQVEKSRVIAIEFTSKDPKLAAAIPNMMAKVYLSLQTGAKLDSNSETTRWLEPEIANLREKVREAEAKVASYRASADLLQTGEAGTGTFATQQLNDISVELARVRGERANAEARAEGVRTTLASGRGADTLGEVVGSAMIQRLKENESNIQAQISDLSTTLLEGHPRLKAMRAQLTGVREQISSETRKILASLENEANVAQLRERQLVQQLNTLKAASAQAGEDGVELAALEREATAQRQLLESYLSRYREATSRTDSNSSPADARIVSTAAEPSDVQFPKVVPITIVAGLSAFLLSSIIIMLSELFSGRALRPTGDSQREEREEIEPVVVETPRRTHAEANASLLSVEPEPKDDLIADENDDAADFSMESVARHIIDNDVRVAISVSPSGDDGSTAAVMLARTISEEGRKIVLIDLTGSACPTRLMAGAAQLPGITNLLSGEIPFTEAIHADRLSDADIIPQGTADPKRAMRGIERLSMIIDALINAYDTVIVECGPADVAGVRRLSRSSETEIVVSAPAFDNDRLIDIVTQFGEAGYTDIVLMTGSSDPRNGHPGRRAA
ncbi:GumC family protein [Pararhizobium sp.]|uniref:GumC family protein n=1 Tax=Pararhizobium sp. TaxID=1977563 RepID=UPI0027227B0B|nr:exopolysaccharide transport family protein [Pararhizobium sp.]MDO9415982.1 exopolysaccharide transport family protein [Pararhizobium sp.]